MIRAPQPSGFQRPENDSRPADPRPEPPPRWHRVLARLDWERARAELRLSRRELDIVRQQLVGLSQSEIAANLELSFGTVKTYTRRVYRKLAVCNRTELTLSVLSAGLGA